MKRLRHAAAALALAAPFFAPAATAQVFVIGSGLGAECYDAAKSGRLSPTIAVDMCTRALREEMMTKSNRAATYVNRGVLYMRDGDYEKALADYEDAERLDGEQGAIYLNRGAAYIYQRDFDSALGPLDKAIALDTQDLYAAHYNRAIARENTGDVEGAYYDFKAALDLRPDWTLAQQQLARFTVTTN
ncbi:MAG: tetratricopeptide repeat protein [Pseudomonadota bacterium]